MKDCAPLYSRLKFISSAFCQQHFLAQAALATYINVLAYVHKSLRTFRDKKQQCFVGFAPKRRDDCLTPVRTGTLSRLGREQVRPKTYDRWLLIQQPAIHTDCSNTTSSGARPRPAGRVQHDNGPQMSRSRITDDMFARIPALLLEGTMTKAEIAAMYGVTLGTLVVLCSQRGVSLRKGGPGLSVPT